MKSLLLIFIINIMAGLTYGQFECSAIGGELKSSGVISNSNDFIPDNNTSIKYIRVNIHFMLRTESHNEYPGNFTSFNDGDGRSSYTGYDYASDLISTANSRLSGNVQMNMPPGNSTDVIGRKYRYVLNGVFFHEDNNHYFYPSYPNGTYGENIGECINVFLNNANGGNGGGHANMSGNRYTEIKGAWERYLDDIASGRGISSGLWVYAHTLNHEIGHNLSLHHTMRYNYGPCYDEMEDYCTDTPTGKEIMDNFGFDPCCGWGGGTNCSNNIMDYSGAESVTPEQLGRVHWTIENEIDNYKKGHFVNSIVTVSGFSENMAYIGEIVEIQYGVSVTIPNGRRLYIDANELLINGEFEVPLGSTFEFKPFGM
jgi:hypothetical protein